MSSGQNDAHTAKCIVPWDGVYQIQNVRYSEQRLGLEDGIVVGRHEDLVDWTITATTVGEDSKITIKYGSYYIGADSKKVVYNTTPYVWNVSYREVGRWIIRDTKSNLMLYLPNENDGTEVGLTQDGAGVMSYWWFIPIRPSSN